MAIKYGLVLIVLQTTWPWFINLKEYNWFTCSMVLLKLCDSIALQLS